MPVGALALYLRLLDRHGSMRAARADAMDWAERAKSALAELPDHPVRDMLSDLADFVVSRVA